MKFETKVGGYWTLSKYKAGADGNPIHDTAEKLAEFPNLITDQGLEFMGDTSGYLSACQVGSGNATPDFTDTGLETWVAGTTTTQSSSSSGGSGSGFRGYVKTFRFAAGVAAGNLSEIGVGTSTSGPNLYSRSLILDSGGNPTTITVLSDEILDATYEHRTYWPTTDGGGTINISGIDYDYVTRAVATKLTNSDFGGYGWGNYGNGAAATIRFGSTANNIGQSAAYDGGLVAMDANQPTGSRSISSNSSSAAYVPGSLTRQGTLIWNTAQGNFDSGISAVKVGFSWCSYQISFDPPIAKNNTQELSLTFTHSWARATIP